MRHTIPAHFFEGVVAKNLMEYHGIPSMEAAFGLTGKFKNDIKQYWASNIDAKTCAQHIHKKWLSRPLKYERPTLKAHLKKGVCIGVFKN